MSEQRHSHEPPRDPLDALFDAEDDPRVGAVLQAVRTRLAEEPDELTVRRHLKAMRAAKPATLARRLLQRSAVAVAAAMVLTATLAAVGSLPGPVQEIAADAAQKVGIQLPRPPAPDVSLPDTAPDEVELPELPDEASDEALTRVPEQVPPAERGPSAGHGLEVAEDRGLDPSRLPQWLQEYLDSFQASADRPAPGQTRRPSDTQQAPADPGKPEGTGSADDTGRPDHAGPPAEPGADSRGQSGPASEDDESGPTSEAGDDKPGRGGGKAEESDE